MNIANPTSNNIFSNGKINTEKDLRPHSNGMTDPEEVMRRHISLGEHHAKIDPENGGSIPGSRVPEAMGVQEVGR